MLAPPSRAPPAVPSAPLASSSSSSDFQQRDSKRNGVCLGSSPLAVARGPKHIQNHRPLLLLCDEWDIHSATDQGSPTLDSVNWSPSKTQHSWKPIAQSISLWRLNLNSDSSPALDAIKMENVHGVDVSWLHNPKTPRPEHRKSASTSTSTPRDLKPPPPTNGHALSHTHSRSPQPSPQPVQDGSRTSYFPGPVTPPALSGLVKNTTAAVPSTPTPANNSYVKGYVKRPSLLNRSSQEKLSSDGKNGPRRSSWISNISSKFSSSTSPPERPGIGPVPTLPSQAQVNAGQASVNGNTAPWQSMEGGEAVEPYEPSGTRSSSSSFFSKLTRQLSAGNQVGGIPKVQGKGGMCERRVLNVDPNRERCLVPELDPARLRKVSFCVDVEIAGGPKYKDEEEDDEEKTQRRKNARLKERAEGEALKHPEALKEEKNEDGEVKSDTKRKPLPIPKDISNRSSAEEQNAASVSPPVGSLDDTGAMSRKKEKKKRSEEERKERKEKRRRRAEENGSIPVELSMDADADNEPESDTFPSSILARKPVPVNGPTNPAADNAAKRDKPTTDPVRIYRRCCQLRETPILKRITEQLMSPTCCVPLEPGVVHCLDLTGSRLQLADMITLGDWLAVVPVKKLLLEDADLSDEGLRCILAGLLAATKPRPTKRKSSEPKHREVEQIKSYQERSGVIEKLHLKNNPRITRTGWKHISLFLYMCRSIKAIDLSMIQFPETMPASTHATPIKSPQNASFGNGIDAAETFYKCLGQRLGGSKLEELIVSECGLSAAQIRKIVDGAIMCGINRLGFGGNNLDDEGLYHILHYLRSGVCGGLDLGGNDLRGKMNLIAEALNDRPATSCWGLSFAGCNMDTASIKPLFSALARLPDFRFVDFSHNPDLCGQDNGTISLLRRYIGQMKSLKRIHLADVGMSSKQAIALADVLPEGPALAHVSILENPQLTALATAKDEESQEEACALYASFMAAVRVSSTLICIDIDVPSADNSEVVKALAKQVVAYSLRNMERFAIAEATGDPSLAADAAASLTQPHGGVKEIAVPDVLCHLVGHVEGNSENHDNDAPAPDGDYIVGGTGVVKALQYVLGSKADDIRRSSVPNSPVAGVRTPRGDRPGSSAGFSEEQRGKAKKMSKNLLESARKIQTRLQPALVKEATQGSDEMAYRRLVFLDQTLQSMISRFEEEYPETRIAPPSPKAPSTTSSTEPVPGLSLDTSIVTRHSDDEDEFDDEGSFRPAISRHNSDVSLASRALGMEEGHLHRLGQRMRREVVDSPSVNTVKTPWTKEEEVARLKQLQDRIESISGPELKSLVEHDGWDSALRKVGMNLNDLRQLQEQDPQAWEEFLDSQMKARMNFANQSQDLGLRTTTKS